MVDEKQGGSGAGDAAPKGDAPSSHDDVNQPGVTNGVPDGNHDADASAVPNTDRPSTENAASGKRD